MRLLAIAWTPNGIEKRGAWAMDPDPRRDIRKPGLWGAGHAKEAGCPKALEFLRPFFPLAYVEALALMAPGCHYSGAPRTMGRRVLLEVGRCWASEFDGIIILGREAATAAGVYRKRTVEGWGAVGTMEESYPLDVRAVWGRKPFLLLPDPNHPGYASLGLDHQGIESAARSFAAKISSK